MSIKKENEYYCGISLQPNTVQKLKKKKNFKAPLSHSVSRMYLKHNVSYWAEDARYKKYIIWFHSHTFQQAKQIYVGIYEKVVAPGCIGGQLTGKCYKGTFWNDGNVLDLA